MGCSTRSTRPNLDNQRDVVKNEKRQTRDNQPYGSWLEHVHELCYPAGHPYHHTTIGSMEDLDAASLEDARAFYATWYAPDNAVLSIVGDVDTAAALDAGRALLRRHPGEGRLPDPAVDRHRAAARRRGTPYRHRPGPGAADCSSAYRTAPFGTPEFDAMQVANIVLGGGRGSRLYKALVLDRQLLQPSDGPSSTAGRSSAARADDRGPAGARRRRHRTCSRRPTTTRSLGLPTA